MRRRLNVRPKRPAWHADLRRERRRTLDLLRRASSPDEAWYLVRKLRELDVCLGRDA